MILTVKPIKGEPTCFLVESYTLRCISCSRLLRRFPANMVWFSEKQKALLGFAGVWTKVETTLEKLKQNRANTAGDQCPKCGGVLEMRFHKVDIAGYNCNGECGCEYFAVTLQKQLRQAPKSEWNLGLHRCSHIEAARDFAIDVVVTSHEYHRLRVNGNGKQREEHAA